MLNFEIVPDGATHLSETYGNVTFYKHVTTEYVSNHVEEILTKNEWFYWTQNQWCSNGESPRLARKL